MIHLFAMAFKLMIGPKKENGDWEYPQIGTRFSSEAQMYCDSKDKEVLVETKGACVCVESRDPAESPIARGIRTLYRHGALPVRGTDAPAPWLADSWRQTTLHGSESSARANRLGAAPPGILRRHGTASR